MVARSFELRLAAKPMSFCRKLHKMDSTNIYSTEQYINAIGRMSATQAFIYRTIDYNLGVMAFCTSLYIKFVNALGRKASQH